MSTIQGDAYRAAWAAWAESMGDAMPDDLHPQYVRPAWNDRRPAARAGRAEQGPRRAPSGMDDSLATVRALRAEAVDGLAVYCAMIAAMTGHLPIAESIADAMAWAESLDTVRASTVRMMGHDSTVPASAASDRRAYAPMSVERLAVGDPERVTVRLWNESGPVDLTRAGGGRKSTYAWLRRHGWQADAISQRESGRAAGLSDTDAANVARTAKHFATALAMIADGTVPAERPGGRGRPAGWQAALAYLIGTGRVERSAVPAWVADVKCPTSNVWEAAAQSAA